MACCRLYLIIVLQFLAYSVDGNVSTTPVIVKSETKSLTGALLTNVTSLMTSPTTDRSSQPIITTEFKRGMLFVFCFCAAIFSEYAAVLRCQCIQDFSVECSLFSLPLPSLGASPFPFSFQFLLRLLPSFLIHYSNPAGIWSPVRL